MKFSIVFEQIPPLFETPHNKHPSKFRRFIIYLSYEINLEKVREMGKRTNLSENKTKYFSEKGYLLQNIKNLEFVNKKKLTIDVLELFENKHSNKK